MVRAIHRYPVKSLRGEAIAQAVVDGRGILGDRLWAVRDQHGKFGSGKSTRRFERMDGLFRFWARYNGCVPVITMPDGATYRGDDPTVHDVLTRWIGRPVRLPREETLSHFDEGPLSLLTTTALAAVAAFVGQSVDARRFRANVLIDTTDGLHGTDGTDGTGAPHMDYPEDAWGGRRVAIGPEVVVAVSHPLDRCLMVNLAQDELLMDPRILRAVAQLHQNRLAVLATIVHGGTFRVGDAVVLL